MQLAEYVQKENIQAYVVGGFVRDSILEKQSKDIDIVCIGSGLELAEGFAKYIGQTEGVEYFKNFGTAHFMSDDVELEFVGARKESYDRGSRKPIVEDGTLEDDLNRRDLTFNAMAISLSADTFGDLIDMFDGLSDLKNGIIRTPLDPDITFSDDPLRMLRAVRFYSRFSLTIHDETLASIIKNRSRLEIISQQRIHDELNKILLTKKPSIGFYMLDQCGLLEMIIPELTALKGVTRVNDKGHKDNFKHTLQVLDQAAEVSDNLWFRWAALLHDVGKGPTKRLLDNGWSFHGHEDVGFGMVREIFKRLCLPLSEKLIYIQTITKYHGKPQQLVEEGVTDSAIRRLCVNVGNTLDDLLLFCKCDITTAREDKKLKYVQEIEDLRIKIEAVRERDNMLNFKVPVEGGDIMAEYKLKPCELVGVIKKAIKEAILEGVIPNDREAALEFMRSNYEKIKEELENRVD